MQKEKNSPGFATLWADHVGTGGTGEHALPGRVSHARENGPQETRARPSQHSSEAAVREQPPRRTAQLVQRLGWPLTREATWQEGRYRGLRCAPRPDSHGEVLILVLRV